MTVRQGSDHPAAYRRVNNRSARGKHARSARRLPWRGLRLRLANENTLTGKASRAFGWSFGGTLLTRLGTFGISIMLARLLGPHEFGMYAVAYVALTAMQTFNELGVSLAIVRWEGDPGKIIPTVATISIAVSALTYIGCFLGAPAYASAMGAPGATSVVRVLAIAILIDGFANAPSGLLQRRFHQRQKVIALQVGGWLGTGVTIALAWSGYGAMSLAVGQVIGALAVVILFVTYAPESLRLGFNRSEARALLRFGLPLAGSNFIVFAVTSVDQLVVGHLLGARMLGYYVLALNLASWPINMFSQPVSAVAPALFSRLQHSQVAMRNTFLSVAGLLGAVALPACLLIAGSARPLITLVYGISWLPAIQPLMWLALLGAMRILFLLIYDYLVVLKRSRFLFIVQLVWLLTLIPVLSAATRLAGLFGAGLAETAVAALVVVPYYLGGLMLVGIRARALGRHLWLPVVGAAVAGLVAMQTARVVPNDFTALAISGVVTVMIISLIVYRMRAVLSLLRATSTDPIEDTAGTSSATNGDGSAAGSVASPAEDITAELAALWGFVDAPATRHRDGVDKNPALERVALSSRPVCRDMTGPLSVYRDVLGYPTRQNLSETSPLYRATIASLNWDPRKSLHRSEPGTVGNSVTNSTGTDNTFVNLPPTTPSRQAGWGDQTSAQDWVHSLHTSLTLPVSVNDQRNGQRSSDSTS